MADKAVEYYGRLDTWVQRAGTAIIAPFEQVTPDEFKRVLDVNLTGVPRFFDWSDFYPVANWGTFAGLTALVLLATQI